ncbi:hypothetical protein RSOLAG1IB_08917 [Rhizoctonia solani AG-1 IB]|uniref:Protein kinase domain-containing protein n=1 Tax=Thanatephorus cucumeris (strain AG1-IB / isolate 7/3/14) TaxID=1108050 RepID=A0A0B7FRT5_THACB|nr:hypothetical protein RSOLAG1IB_08917 [Rhizoctonia solani AG-1 IB]
MSTYSSKRPHSPSPSSPPAKRQAQSLEEGEVESSSPPRERRHVDSYRPHYSRSPSRSPLTRRHRLPPRPSSPPREWDRWPPSHARIPGRTRNPYLEQETFRPLDTPGAPVADERVGIEQPDEKEEGEEEDRRRPRPIDPKLNSAVEDTIARIEREANEAEAKLKDKPKVLRLSPDQEMQAYGRKFVGTSQLRDYAILEKLGEGTFGEVHKATHTVTRKVVALKRILMHNEKEGLPVTALREIKILKMLTHPSVVPLSDMVVEASTRDKKGSIYMVFPYMDHDLAGLLENPSVKFSPSQIKLYMRQLLEGTDYLHRNNILHRDLKAANLLINNHGSLQIADFGLARPFSRSNPGWDPRSTSEMPWDTAKGGPERGGGGAKYTNCVVTRWYRPPELLMGEARYGCAIDMWGVGCIMGEMWTRRPILCGSSDPDQLEKIWELCGTPDDATWPGWRDLPSVPPIERKLPNKIKQYFRQGTSMDEQGMDLVEKLLFLNPAKRPTALEALDHEWFWCEPLCCDPASLPKYVSSHEYDKRKLKAEAAHGFGAGPNGFGPGGPPNGFVPGGPPNGFGPGVPPNGFGPGGPPNGFGPGVPNGFGPGGPPGPNGFGPGGPPGPNGFGPGGPPGPNGFGPGGPGFGPGGPGFGPPGHGGRGQWGGGGGGGWDRGGRGGGGRGGGGRGRGGRGRGGHGGHGGHGGQGGFDRPPQPPGTFNGPDGPTNFSGYSRDSGGGGGGHGGGGGGGGGGIGGGGLPPPLGTHSREHRQMRERNMNMRNTGRGGAGAGGTAGKVPSGTGGDGEFLPYG